MMILHWTISRPLTFYTFDAVWPAAIRHCYIPTLANVKFEFNTFCANLFSERSSAVC